MVRFFPFLLSSFFLSSLIPYRFLLSIFSIYLSLSVDLLLRLLLSIYKCDFALYSILYSSLNTPFILHLLLVTTTISLANLLPLLLSPIDSLLEPVLPPSNLLAFSLSFPPLPILTAAYAPSSPSP